MRDDALSTMLAESQSVRALGIFYLKLRYFQADSAASESSLNVNGKCKPLCASAENISHIFIYFPSFRIFARELCNMQMDFTALAPAVPLPVPLFIPVFKIATYLGIYRAFISCLRATTSAFP